MNIVHFLHSKDLMYFNLFVPNAPFLYPNENIRKPYGLLFSEGKKKGAL